MKIRTIRQSGLFSLWSIIILIVLALIIFIPALGEYYSGKRDLLRLWNQQGQLLSETILRSAAKISVFNREAEQISHNRLMDLGLFVRQLDSLHYPDKRMAARFIRRQAGFWPLYLNAEGQILGNRFYRSSKALQERINRYFSAHAQIKMVTLIPALSKSAETRPLVLIRRVRNQGFIVLLPPRHPFGAQESKKRLKRWLDHLTKNSSIAYIVLYDQKRILAQSGLRPARSVALPGDSQFAKSRRLSGKNIYEYRRQEANGIRILIGLSTSSIESLRRNLTRRLLLNSFILLILGGVFIVYSLKRQSYSLLTQKYAEVQTYSGSILENMDEAIIMLEENQQVRLFNRAAENLFKRPAEQVLGKRLSETELPLPAPLLLEFIAGHSFTEHPLSLTLGNERKHLLISARPLSYSEESAPRLVKKLYLIFIYDISWQRELEEMRSRKNKLMAMGELASRVAHEIRNPLNGIGLLAQRLAKEFRPSGNATEFEQMTGSIRRESARINEIIETFLNYARSPHLKFKNINLKHFIENNARLFESLGPMPFKYRLSEHCYASIDPDQFKQALINLLKNAAEATTDGSAVNLRLKCDAAKILLFVEDRGPGIPLKNQDQIFDLYFTTKSGGTGLGLSIVEKIISAHQGEIRVESPYFVNGIERHGTRFIIELPLINNSR